MTDKQLLFSKVGCSVLEPVEIEVLGEGSASGAGMETRRNVGTGVKVDSDGLTEAGEEQRDEEAPHAVMVAAGVNCQASSTAFILWFCLVL